MPCSKRICYGFWLCFGAVMVAAVTRCPEAFFRAEFWAEDGADFFPQALNGGVLTLLEPNTGYLCFIPRVIAYLASWLPVVAVPFVYAWASLVYAAVAIAWIARDGYSWVVPSRAARFFLVLAIACGAGAAEVVGNLCNLHSVAFFWSGVLLLEAVPRWSLWRWSALLTAALTAPEFFLLALLPLLPQVRFPESRTRVMFFSLCVLSALGHTLANKLTSPPGYEATAIHFAALPTAVINNFLLRTLFAPLVGPDLAQALGAKSDLVFASLAMALLAFYFTYLKRRETRPPALVGLVALCACAAASLGLVLIGRHYAYASVGTRTELVWNTRYAFVSGAFSLLTVWAVFSASGNSPRPVRRALGLVGLLAAAWVVIAHPSHPAPRPNLQWPETAARVQRVLVARQRGELNEPVTIEGLGLHPNGYARVPVVVYP